jgi:hypothetical protein
MQDLHKSLTELLQFHTQRQVTAVATPSIASVPCVVARRTRAMTFTPVAVLDQVVGTLPLRRKKTSPQ